MDPSRTVQHLPANMRQIVILVVGTRFGAVCEIYAHSAVARAAGISENQLTIITAGSRPSDLSEEEKTAYDIATSLFRGGVLSESVYQHALGLKRLKGLLYERNIQQLVERDVDFRADYVGCLDHCGLGVCFPNSKRQSRQREEHRPDARASGRKA
jgi:hypothetical protein